MVRKRLLLVDDEPVNLELLEAYLEPLDCELLRANGGAEACARFDADAPDLVLLDVMMPDVDGFEVLRHIRRSQVSAYVPVVLITAAPERDLRLRGIELGASEFLEKPIDRAILIARLRTLMRLKEASDGLAARNAELVSLRERTAELMSFVVHDMKTPMAVIATNVAFAREQAGGAGASEVTEALDDAEAACKRLGDMVGDLLVIARLENAALPLALERLDVARAATQASHARARDAQSRPVDVVVDVPPGVEIQVDPSLVQRLLENLLDNALRYTPARGRIAVEARVAGDSVSLVVSNTGAAIPAEERTRMFDKFARAEGRTRAARGNVGLGLYFCKLVAQAHGGDIVVESSEAWPTSFVVRFPGAARR
jgi:two-component system sensor histidine kinase/response regulator